MQTVDDWWSNGASCLIPGSTSAYPSNYPSRNVCGGEAAVQITPFIDSGGNEYGKVYLFRDYRGRLIATVALNGSPSSQWLMQVPTRGERFWNERGITALG